MLGMHVLENCLCSPQVSKGGFFFFDFTNFWFLVLGGRARRVRLQNGSV